MRIFALALALTVLLPGVSDARPAAIAVRHPAAITIATFVKQASRFDAYELKSGEMALRLSHNAAIRAFARRMLSAHRSNRAALASVLAKMHSSLKPDAFVMGAHGTDINELEAVAGADFDETYKAQQMDNHRAAVRLYTDYAAHGRNRKLRAFAAAAVPILQRHFALSRQLLSR